MNLNEFFYYICAGWFVSHLFVYYSLATNVDILHEINMKWYRYFIVVFGVTMLWPFFLILILISALSNEH